MANNWNIPADLEREFIERDRVCVYCGVTFTPGGPRRSRPSWEHIVNDARIVTRENIARCCMGCNASKGAKDLAVWMQSTYCVTRGITAATVAPVIRAALAAGTRRA
jgi:hypothetical protein